MKLLHVDAVGNHADLAGRAALVRGQITSMRRGHGNEGVGQRGQEAIGPFDPVGQAGRVQGRADHRRSDEPGGQPAPKHLVARSDGHDGVDPPPPQQAEPAAQGRRNRICAAAGPRAPDMSPANSAPNGPSSFRQHNSGRNRARFMRRINSASSVSAPPTGMLVNTNITRNGPRSSSETKGKRRRRVMGASVSRVFQKGTVPFSSDENWDSPPSLATRGLNSWKLAIQGPPLPSGEGWGEGKPREIPLFGARPR